MNANTLTVYDQFQDPQSGIQVLGTAIAKSGMFGCESEHQGIVLAMECFARRQPPLTLQEKYHLIKGKLSMKADAMLAGFNQGGGKHRIIERTADRAAIELELDSQKQVFSLTWEDAQNEPFVYNGNESDTVKSLAKNDKSKLTLKAKYATPRSRSQMMWARVVSDGVRAMMPGVNCGNYTPEELEDAEEGNTAPARSNGKSKAPAAASTTASAPAAQQPGGVIDGEFEVKSDKPANTPAAAASTTTTTAPPAEPTGLASREQCRRITDLFCKLQLSTDAIDKILAKRNVTATQSLKAEQAAEIIAGLEKKVAQAEATATAATNYVDGQSRSNPAAETITPATPCSQSQIDAIKAALQEMKQIVPTCVTDVVQKLAASGKSKLADLSSRDASLLLEDAKNRTLDTFFQRSLETWQPAEKPATENPADQIDMNQPSATAEADVPFDVPGEAVAAQSA